MTRGRLSNPETTAKILKLLDSEAFKSGEINLKIIALRMGCSTTHIMHIRDAAKKEKLAAQST